MPCQITRNPIRHDMLLVKSDLDEYGIPYWESPNGEGGYIRIRKKVTGDLRVCLVTYMEFSLILLSYTLVMYMKITRVSVPADDILKSVEFDV
ncbi:hypothetical protein YC2023_054985 [Brassica napus]